MPARSAERLRRISGSARAGVHAARTRHQRFGRSWRTPRAMVRWHWNQTRSGGYDPRGRRTNVGAVQTQQARPIPAGRLLRPVLSWIACAAATEVLPRSSVAKDCRVGAGALRAAAEPWPDPNGQNLQARRIQRFVDDLSNWYVRRGRRRFWKAETDEDKDAAYQTLYRCLMTLASVLAPFMPHLSEAMYRNLIVDSSGGPESVHLTRWPEYDPASLDERLHTVKVFSGGHQRRQKRTHHERTPSRRHRDVNEDARPPSEDAVQLR